MAFFLRGRKGQVHQTTGIAPDKVKLANLGSKKDGESQRPCTEVITELSLIKKDIPFPARDGHMKILLNRALGCMCCSRLV